jgi:signal transduction histidine kinase
MDRDSQIVIGPDGIVLAATGELPSGLVDMRLEDCEGLSRELRDAELIAIEGIAIRRRATDLRTLLPSKLTVISSEALASHVTLKVVVADDVPAVVYLDSEKVAWAVTTLVGNALRYVLSGLRRKPGGRIDVLASFNAATSDVTIEVRDDGPGIPADSVARLLNAMD